MANPLSQIAAGVRRYLADLNGSFFVDESALLDPGAHGLRAFMSKDPDPEVRPDADPAPLLAPLDEFPIPPLDVDPGLAGGT
jgi:hypothetical protein